MIGQRAAVGVAQDQDRRAAGASRLQRLQRVFGILLEAVEEMLGVVEHFAALGETICRRIADHVQIFFERGAEHLAHLHVPGFADKRDDRGLPFDQRLQAGVIGRFAVLAASHAEGGDFGVLERQLADFLEVLKVLGIGERIAAFDVIDAEVVQPARDQQLILEGEVNAFALAAVAKRCVVDGDAGHGLLSGEW